MSEKRTAQLPAVRCRDALEIALMRLAARDERSLSDYINLVLEHHAFGHAPSMGDEGGEGQNCSALQCSARKAGRE